MTSHDVPLRVLHIGKFFPPHAGGIERSSADLTAALAARGVTTAMLAHAEPGTRAPETQRVDDVDVKRVRCYGQVLHTPVSPAFPFVLQKLVRDFRPDLLHLHVPNPSAFWALLSRAARRVPWIVHWHSDVPLDAAKMRLRLAYRLYKPWEQGLLRRTAAIIATSQRYRDASFALAPWREKVSVIPLGLNPMASPTTAANPIPWSENSFRVLAVGRLSYYKGFDVLLRALAKTRDAQLVLIGSGDCDSMLRQLASDLGISNRVRFLGYVDDDVLAAAYASADIFCLPSIERSEAFGLVLLEAMRARLPTLATSIEGSGVGFVVVDNETGILVPPGDANALAVAIDRLASDPDLRRRFGDAGERRWRENFTLDRVADQTLQLYREVLEKKRHRARATPGT